MPRILPLRWTPALNMWRRGDSVTDIAAMYSADPKFMSDHIAALRDQYPTTFPSRSNAALVEVKVQRLVARPSLRMQLRAPRDIVTVIRSVGFKPRPVIGKKKPGRVVRPQRRRSA